MADLLVQTAVFAASVVGLALGARALVDASVALARRVGLSDLVVGLTVVAAGTSAPEIVVTADAAFAGLGDVAVGNVAGSNIYNVALVLGVLAIIRPLRIRRSLVRRDGAALLATTVLFAVVVADRVVTRLEGVLLVAVFVAYTAYLLRDASSAAASTPTNPEGGDGPAANPDGGDEPAVPVRVATTGAFGVRDAVVLVVGLAVVLASGHYLVESATVIAQVFGFSDAVIGGTVVAAGTSTPELAVSLVALRRGSRGVSVGNVVGSSVFNVLVALGVGAVIRPLVVSPAILEVVAWLVAVVVAAVALMWTGRQLSRPEGVAFTLSEVVRWVAGILGYLG